MHTQKLPNEWGKKVWELILASTICFFCVAALLSYIFWGYGTLEQSDAKETQAKTTKESAKLEFDHEKYALSVNCPQDMSQYLQCFHVEKGEILWSVESNQVQIGEDGRVWIQNYDVTSKLTARSKKDASVLATCEVCSLSEEEDLKYKVNHYNMVSTHNQEQQDGMMWILPQENLGNKIAVYEENFTAAEIKNSYQWNQSLFYRLEKVKGSKGGGGTNGYRIVKKQFVNADNGNIMEYEIFYHSKTNDINKIVSIEHMATGLEVTEYYYSNDKKVNFTFQYQTDNYQSGDVNTDIPGECCLYDNDAMVTWRIIEGKNKITNYYASKREGRRLKKTGWARVKEYEKMSIKKKKRFRTVENRMLNAAYNTLNIIEKYDGISIIQGQVCDAEDVPLPHVNVKLYSSTFNSHLYTCTTDDAGNYELFVPARTEAYEIIFSLGDKNSQEKIYHLDLTQSDLKVEQEIVHMVQDTSLRSYKVHLQDATKNAENKTAGINHGELIFRRGINNDEGEIRLSIYTNGTGFSSVALEPGMYTVETRKNGYLQEYRNIFFGLDSDKEILILLTPGDKKDNSTTAPVLGK